MRTFPRLCCVHRPCDDHSLTCPLLNKLSLMDWDEKQFMTADGTASVYLRGRSLHSGTLVGSWRAFHRRQSGLTYASWLSAPHEPLGAQSRTRRSPSIILAFALQSVVVCCFKKFFVDPFRPFQYIGSGCDSPSHSGLAVFSIDFEVTVCCYEHGGYWDLPEGVSGDVHWKLSSGIIL